jgi:molecular chaperone DnaK
MLKLIKKQIRKKESQLMQETQADTLIHSTEKNLKEHGAKVSDAEKKAIEDASSALKRKLKR